MESLKLYKKCGIIVHLCDPFELKKGYKMDDTHRLVICQGRKYYSFPKGHRKMHKGCEHLSETECNLCCAQRECYEETNIKTEDMITHHFKEVICKTVYYHYFIKEEIKNIQPRDTNEILDVQILNINEICELIKKDRCNKGIQEWIRRHASRPTIYKVQPYLKVNKDKRKYNEMKRTEKKKQHIHIHKWNDWCNKRLRYNCMVSA